jgi:ATP-dependent DNA helicase RecQ
VDGDQRPGRRPTQGAGGWEATGQPWVYDEERYQRVAQERIREQQAMLAYQTTDACRMEYLRLELDDPEATGCGRCDNCTGQRRDQEVPQASASAARQRLLRPGVGVEPRRMWPPGMKDLGISGASGKIPLDRTAEPGRALGRLTEVGWGTTLLIDDRIETGWTMTVAPKHLREAGAPAVLPLVLAVTTG